MSKFRNKPKVIDAVQYTGDNSEAIVEFVGNNVIGFSDKGVTLDTLEGTMLASPMDWIIRGIKGELYPCKPDIFDLTYEAVT